MIDWLTDRFGLIGCESNCSIDCVIDWLAAWFIERLLLLLTTAPFPSNSLSHTIWFYRSTFVLCLALYLMECLKLSAVHAKLLAARSLMQALAQAVKKLTTGRQPSSPVASHSRRRQRRRQATFCKSYAASHGDPVASDDKESQVPS